ncbi:MAG: hypothetical protein WAS34_11080 [Thiolinea sp.]
MNLRIGEPFFAMKGIVSICKGQAFAVALEDGRNALPLTPVC